MYVLMGRDLQEGNKNGDVENFLFFFENFSIGTDETK